MTPSAPTENEIRLRVLQAVEDRGIENTSEVAEALDLPVRRAVSVVKGLIEDRLLAGKDGSTKDGAWIGFIEVTSSGRRVLDQGLDSWPQPLGSIQIGNLSGNVQVGSGNVMNVDARVHLELLIQRIDQMNAPQEQKEEVKTWLRQFAEHPLTSAFAGATFTALLEAMS